MEPIKRNMEPSKERQESAATDPQRRESSYSPPKLVDLGAVEELTHGSRENTADDGSGYKGG